MAESSSSASVSKGPTRQGMTAQQEKESATSIALPKKPRKLTGEVC